MAMREALRTVYGRDVEEKYISTLNNLCELQSDDSFIKLPGKYGQDRQGNWGMLNGLIKV